MDGLLEGLRPHLPLNGDMIVQEADARGPFNAMSSGPFRFIEVLPHIVAGATGREIQTRLPGIREGAIRKSRRIFRAKFMKAAGYRDMPHMVAMFDENMSYRFSEVARGFTGISTYAMAENLISASDDRVYETARAAGVDLIFTRDLALHGWQDISWHADKQLRNALEGVRKRKPGLPHFPLIVQVAADVRGVDDFTACMDRDIMALYCVRFGLLSPICRMMRDGLQFIKVFSDYTLPGAVLPKRKPLNTDRHIKAWLKMAYGQERLADLPPQHKRGIKDLARYILKGDETEWRAGISENERRQLAMPARPSAAPASRPAP